jgi:rod shape-determining protein MreC
MAAGNWKLARNRGSVTKQLPLAACMVVAIVVLLLGRAEASIFDSARAKFTDWSAPAIDVIRGPIDMVQHWGNALSAMFTVYEENVALREENEALRRWQDVALTLEEEVTRYEELLNAVPDLEMPSMAARVIGQSSRPFTKTLILNAGTNQNARKGQAVIDHRGLIGRIYVAGANTSWVLPVTDLNSRIPVVIRPSNRRAILLGNDTIAPYLRLDTGEIEVKEGDRVFTTGDGGVLPPELPVGVVVGDEDDLRAALFSNPRSADFVRIVDYVPEVEAPLDEGLPVSMLPEEGVETPDASAEGAQDAVLAGEVEVGAQ